MARRTNIDENVLLDWLRKLRKIKSNKTGIMVLIEFGECWRKNHHAQRQCARFQKPEIRDKQQIRCRQWYAQNKNELNKKRREAVELEKEK